MEAEKVAFWGIVLKPGEPAELELQDGETLHVTNASLGEELADGKGRSVITATVTENPTIDDDDDDDESNEDKPEIKKKYAITCLNAGRNETALLDVSFVGDENVKFEVSGKNAVHLVGSFSFDHITDEESDSDEESDLIGVYDDDSDSEEDLEETVAALQHEPRLLTGATMVPDNDPPIITELKDDSNEEEEEEEEDKQQQKKGKESPASKKANNQNAKKVKFANGKATNTSPAGKQASAKKEKAAAKNSPKPSKSPNKGSKAPPPKKDDSDEIMEDIAEDKAATDNSPANGAKPKETPKNKRRKRKSGANEIQNANGSTPEAKKSKLSERQATPASNKSTANKKDGDKDAEETPAKNNTPGASSSKKRKKKKNNKNNN